MLSAISTLISSKFLTTVSYPSALHVKEPANVSKDRKTVPKSLCYSLLLLADAILNIVTPCTYWYCISINIHDTKTHAQARDCMKNIKTF